MEDVVIIGAGIIGSFLAYDLSHYHVKVVVIESENDVANEVTMANSAIIHTGYDPDDGTLKAQLNVLGAQMYPRIAKLLHADYEQVGAFVVAHNKDEQDCLSVLETRCKERLIQCKRMLRDEFIKMEENIADDVIEALWVPETAIIYPWEMAIRLMEVAITNGVELNLRHKVNKIDSIKGGYRVFANGEHWDTKIVINAAGLGAEKIAHLLHEKPFITTYKRGQYYVLAKQKQPLVKHIVYPVPTVKGKGVLAVPTTHGNTLLGPNTEIIEDTSVATTAQGLAIVKQQIANTIKNVPFHEVIRTYSGIRPSGNGGDFYIKESKQHPCVFHVACIDSPGLASAPAISNYVIHNLLANDFQLIRKRAYIQCLPLLHMNVLSHEHKQKCIERQPGYGRIICRCENISEQEIIDAIHRPCGARSIKGIKKRVRPGMGKCQGGFCEIEVAKILARELNIPLSQVLYDTQNSMIGEEVKPDANV